MSETDNEGHPVRRESFDISIRARNHRQRSTGGHIPEAKIGCTFTVVDGSSQRLVVSHKECAPASHDDTVLIWDVMGIQGGIKSFSKPKLLDWTALQFRQDRRPKLKREGSVRVGWALWLRGDDTMAVRGGPWPRPGSNSPFCTFDSFYPVMIGARKPMASCCMTGSPRRIKIPLPT